MAFLLKVSISHTCMSLSTACVWNWVLVYTLAATCFHVSSHIYRTIPKALSGTESISTQSSRSRVPEIIAWIVTFPTFSVTDIDSLVCSNPIVTTVWNKRVFDVLCHILVNNKGSFLILMRHSPKNGSNSVHVNWTFATANNTSYTGLPSNNYWIQKLGLQFNLKCQVSTTNSNSSMCFRLLVKYIQHQ